MQSSRNVPSRTKPSFSSTRADAALRVSVSAWTRLRSSVSKYFALHPHGQHMSGRWDGMSYDGKIVSGWGAMARTAEDATSIVDDLKKQEHGVQRADV
jgi:hypothetical protein